MVNNQNEFNYKFPRELERIKIKYEDFQGQLVVEDYLDLEELYFCDVDSIDKITLKNLPRLQECTIWDCGMQDLVIENCPQIKRLNLRGNLLTSLEFLKSLPNLEELEIDGNTEINSNLEYLPNSLKKFSCENTKLVEILKPYKSDWKTYQKDVQELVELVSHKPQQLLKSIQVLKEENKRLKDKQPIIVDNQVDFEKKYQKLKKALSSLLKGEEPKSKEMDLLVTEDDLIKSIEKQKQDLSNLQKSKKELEEKLTYFEQTYLIKRQRIERKEKELEELKAQMVAENSKIEEDLEELLESQAELVNNNYSESWKKQLERSRKRLIKKVIIEKLDILCQLQTEITQLKLEIQKSFNKVDQIFHIDSVVNFKESTNLKPYLKQKQIVEEEKLETISEMSEETLIPSDEKEFQKLKNEHIQEWLEELKKETEQESKTPLERKESEITLLELRILELIKFTKKQKEKVINAYLNFFSEKDLLKNLIIAQLEFTKASKEKLPSVKLRRQRDKFRDELEEKLGEEQIEEIQTILIDCEELVALDIELEERLDKKLTWEKEKELEGVCQKSLAEQLKIRKSELENSLNEAKKKNKSDSKLGLLLELLLKIQVNIIEKGGDSFEEKQFANLATIVEEAVGEKELENICQKQKIIIYLEEIIQFEKSELELKVKKEKEIEQIATQIEILPK